MLKKLACGLVCAGALMSTAALATTHTLTASGTSIDYELAPNDPQIFKNDWIWTITATCTIKTQDDSNELFIEGLKKQGTVNGQAVSESDQFSYTVYNDSKLTIVAKGGAQVRLTNKGLHTITAKCIAG